MKTHTITQHTHQRASGRFRCQVLDGKTGKVKRDYGWQKNLILNQGMNGIGNTRSWADSFQYCAVGTGTTPTQNDGGATTAAQSGTTVTLTGGSFTFTDTGTDAGKMIKWTGGQEARIVTVTSPTVCEVHVSQSVSDDTFTVFRTNQTGLTTEVKRSNTYLTGAGNCDTTYTPGTGTVVMRRTIDFSIETGAVSYTEVGMSHTATVAANLFSRILLTSAVNLVDGDQLRVIYDLTIVFSVYAPQAITPTITGWTGTDGSQMLENWGLEYVQNTGLTVSTGQWVNDPFRTANVRFAVSNSTTALQTEPQSANVTNRNGSSLATKLVSASSYTSLSFTRTRSVQFLVGEANITGIRSIFICYYPGTGSTYYVNTAFLLDNPQDKLNTHTLSLNWVYSWSRVLA